MRRRHETCPSGDSLRGTITEVPNNARNQSAFTMVHSRQGFCTSAGGEPRPVAVDQGKTTGCLWWCDCLGASTLCPVGSLDCYASLRSDQCAQSLKTPQCPVLLWH